MTQIIVTLGPATRTEEDLRFLKSQGVDFVRINMSHSNLKDLRYFIKQAKKVGLPFIIDTEGSQLRTGDLEKKIISFRENSEVKIYRSPVIGTTKKISLHPPEGVAQIERGDLLHVDFDSLILRVRETSTLAHKGYILATVVAPGTLGRNKAVIVDQGFPRPFLLPTLSPKDRKSIRLGLAENISHIAASFIRSGQAVEDIRQATQSKMKIISKIECLDALEHLDEIIEKSDMLLIDRGDLSKEIPLEKIPFAQKIILQAAQRQNKPVFIATNLLESMVERNRPTRAEARDVITSVLEGATGVTLSAETAIGRYPLQSVSTMRKLLNQADLITNTTPHQTADKKTVRFLNQKNYLLDNHIGSSIILPHGGKLVDRTSRSPQDDAHLSRLKCLPLNEEQRMDVEQIGLGTYSPLEGFLGSGDLESVLEKMCLSTGITWPLPIVLDVGTEIASTMETGEDIALTDRDGAVMAVLHLTEKYSVDKDEFVYKLYGTTSDNHPGVRWARSLEPVFLAGPIDLLRRRQSDTKHYEITPHQTRKLFRERGWSTIIGFHSRNVIHRGHEFIQLEALKLVSGDGLFIHPIIGKKKTGDWATKYIIESYETMLKKFYPPGKTVFSVFSTFSRYAGPREAIFTALCRKNFGCSHFIVGRDHTGVSDFYHPRASQDIFAKFEDLGIKPIFFDQVFYSKKGRRYIHLKDALKHSLNDRFSLSGSAARKIFEKGKCPPSWFMRPEISQTVKKGLRRGDAVFFK